jgi:hypothetical protein
MTTWARLEPPVSFDPGRAYPAVRVLVNARFSVPSAVASWNAFNISLADTSDRVRFRRTNPPVLAVPPLTAQQVLDDLVRRLGSLPAAPFRSRSTS